MRTDWTPAMDKTLIDLWHKGLSLGQIANSFGGGKLSRSALSGRLARLRGRGGKIHSRPSKPATPIKKAVKPAAPAAPNPPAWLPPWPLVPFMGNQGCKWPCTETKPFMFCGGPREGDTPYCRDHNRMSWRKT